MTNNEFAKYGAFPAVSASLLALFVLFSPLAFAQSLAENIEAVDECVQKLDKTELPAPVAEVLKMDRTFVEKALLQEGLRVSDLIFIRALAQKTGRQPEQILSAHANRDWDAALKQAGLPEAEMAQIMDDAYADLALKMMDFPRKKDGVKRTAKR